MRSCDASNDFIVWSRTAKGRLPTVFITNIWWWWGWWCVCVGGMNVGEIETAVKYAIQTSSPIDYRYFCQDNGTRGHFSRSGLRHFARLRTAVRCNDLSRDLIGVLGLETCLLYHQCANYLPTRRQTNKHEVSVVEMSCQRSYTNNWEVLQ